MKKNKDIIDLYNGAICLSSLPNKPSNDWEIEGTNKDGFPILSSKKDGTSIQFIIFNLGNG